MPEVLSVALGGGTKVVERHGKVYVGPESVGHKLISEGLVFGGNTLTTTGMLSNAPFRLCADFAPRTSLLRLVTQRLATLRKSRILKKTSSRMHGIV